MSSGNGRNFKTEYIRAILKRTNISLIYGKTERTSSTSPLTGPSRDKPIKAVIKLRRPVSLEDSPVRIKSEKTVTFREPIEVSGSATMAWKQNQNEADAKSASSERAASETRHRLRSENSATSKDTAPDRQRPRTHERAENALPKFGTIRRSYEPDKKFRPLAVFKAFERTPEPETNVESDLTRDIGASPGSELSVDDNTPKPGDEQYTISTFPYVKDDDIDKHKQLNAEAELLGKLKPPGPYDSYLKRLKLERKAHDPKKPKDPTKGKKGKNVFKRMQTRARWARDVPEESEPEKTPSPPPRTKEDRANKMLLDFKYSHAVEQLYRTQMRQSVSFSPMSDSFVNYSYRDETEVKNGCLVKTLGANVLNLRARTLPSCNPFELRKRLAREKAMLTKKASLVSQVSVKSNFSQDSLLKLRKISVCRKESSVSNAFTDESGSTSVLDPEHARLQVGRKSMDSQIGLPNIRVDRVESLATRSLNSSPDGPEYLRKLSNPHTKTISLNLPTVLMEDL